MGIRRLEIARGVRDRPLDNGPDLWLKGQGRRGRSRKGGMYVCEEGLEHSSSHPHSVHKARQVVEKRQDREIETPRKARKKEEKEINQGKRCLQRNLMFPNRVMRTHSPKQSSTRRQCTRS